MIMGAKVGDDISLLALFGSAYGALYPIHVAPEDWQRLPEITMDPDSWGHGISVQLGYHGNLHTMAAVQRALSQPDHVGTR